MVDQCWNQGCISLILLRRVKRKAPLPPCDVSESVNTPVSSNKCEHLQHNRCASESTDNLANSKRTRKFGVITRTSFNRDNRVSSDAEEWSSSNGYRSSLPTDAEVSPPGDGSGCILSTRTPKGEIADMFPQVRTVLQNSVEALPFHLQDPWS